MTLNTMTQGVEVVPIASRREVKFQEPMRLVVRNTFMELESVCAAEAGIRADLRRRVKSDTALLPRIGMRTTTKSDWYEDDDEAESDTTAASNTETESEMTAPTSQAVSCGTLLDVGALNEHNGQASPVVESDRRCSLSELLYGSQAQLTSNVHAEAPCELTHNACNYGDVGAGRVAAFGSAARAPQFPCSQSAAQESAQQSLISKNLLLNGEREREARAAEMELAAAELNAAALRAKVAANRARAEGAAGRQAQAMEFACRQPPSMLAWPQMAPTMVPMQLGWAPPYWASGATAMPCPPQSCQKPSSMCGNWQAAPQSFQAGVRTPEQDYTTVMFRNLPNDYTRDMFLELLDAAGFAGCYDFVYLPFDFKKQSNLGYAFANLLTHDHAQRAWAGLEGFRDWKVASQKVLSVSWSKPLQGLAANIERYRDSPVMHKDVPERFKPLLFKKGRSVKFPPPTRKLVPPASQ